MNRTPEQIEAGRALGAAIERVKDAYTTDGQARMIVDTMTIYAWTFFDDAGDQVSGVSLAFPAGEGPPHYRCFGLLQAADVELQQSMSCACEDDED